MAEQPPPSKNPLKRLAALRRDARQGDVVAAEVGEGARGVAVGKNIVQIGTLVVPLVPVLIALLILLMAAGAVAYTRLVPARMPVDPDFPYFNVAIADFGQVEQDGRVTASDAGRRLSGYMFDALKRELVDQKEIQDHFKLTVWNDSMSLFEKRAPIGIMADMTAAQKLAGDIGANVVIFGNFSAEAGAGSFVPEFYVAPLQNEADEIVGLHQLGAPINKGGLNLRAELVDRQKILTNFTLGLLYDLNGRQSDALNQFESALNISRAANPEAPPTARKGEEVLQFFIGRNHLYLEQDVAAEMAFTQSLEVNPQYARAHIGLGSVYYQRAERYKPEERLDKPELQAALTEYQTALDDAVAASDWNVVTKAKLNLAYTHRLFAESYLVTGDSAKAEETYQRVIALTDEVKPALERQYRLLAQMYSLRGSAYFQMSYIPEDEAAIKDLLNKAYAEYDNCIKQGAPGTGNPNDAFLTDKIIGAICKPHQDQVAQELSAMP
jgi:tetratricopeptide (TPR) repeat protein